MTEWKNGLRKKLSEYRYVILVGVVGLVLMLWSGTNEAETDERMSRDEEIRMASLLSAIEGVGEAQVLLSDSGAVIVCDGADSASVCLKITQAVKTYTGLGADKVEIFKVE